MSFTLVDMNSYFRREIKRLSIEEVAQQTRKPSIGLLKGFSHGQFNIGNRFKFFYDYLSCFTSLIVIISSNHLI